MTDSRWPLEVRPSQQKQKSTIPTSSSLRAHPLEACGKGCHEQRRRGKSSACARTARFRRVILPSGTTATLNEGDEATQLRVEVGFKGKSVRGGFGLDEDDPRVWGKREAQRVKARR
jgi:hypothetical protein